MGASMSMGHRYIKTLRPNALTNNPFPPAASRLQVKGIITQRTLHNLFSLTLVAVLALLSSVLAVNQPTLVNLRIEGSTNTIFEGPIITRGHNVTTVSGGTHHCDGTNNNANPTPGPTCTSALDDASKIHHFTFDGYVSYFLISHCAKWLIHGAKCYSTFSTEFDDFFITSIGGVTQTATEFWGILLNFQFIPVGGCQQEVKLNDDILFAFNAFNAVHFLKLTGPETANVGSPVLLTVTDGQTGSPVAGADVNGDISDANGHVSVTFAQVGLQKVKATKSDSIRSNQLSILVI